ncbi:hypothetical protein AGLY_015203 [Aphis glycines]|uniref:Uncharacterized protein n=1 Tax=Aphis glycines TaxID=307491 RepID=A0A6G0T153_APHGL|nr:hypothetical protein AGLY_015203 [Aphis glycines]
MSIVDQNVVQEYAIIDGLLVVIVVLSKPLKNKALKSIHSRATNLAITHFLVSYAHEIKTYEAKHFTVGTYKINYLKQFANDIDINCDMPENIGGVVEKSSILLLLIRSQQKIKMYFVTFGPFKIPTRSNLLLKTVETTLKVAVEESFFLSKNGCHSRKREEEVVVFKPHN